MTCIVAVRGGDCVYMAADSQQTANGGKSLVGREKIQRFGELLVACDGPLSFADLVDTMDWDSVSGDDLRIALRPIAKAIRDSCIESKMTDDEHGRHALPGSILIARGTQFAKIDANGAVVTYHTTRRFATLGSGGAEASGALLSMDAIEAGKAAFRAVEMACDLDDGCSPPVILKWTGPNEG